MRRVGILGLWLLACAAHASAQNCENILVLDGYSTGALLAPHLRELGYGPTHMHSEPNPADFLMHSFHREDYTADLSPQSYEEALAMARRLKPSAVMVGSETGVIFASKLLTDLGFTKPVSEEVIQARRDKFLMAERLRSLGIAAVKQVLTGDLTTALEWVKREKLFPGRVVLKPPMSGGADSVYICRDEREFRHAFDTIRKLPNFFGKPNLNVLVQEFLDGTEYVVNTVSAGGVHKVTDMWMYHKIERGEGRRVYDYDILLDSRGELQDSLVRYTKQVLDALQIELGWGHAEIIVTKRGPVLVEIGNRMMGSKQPVVVKAAMGISQVEIGAMAFLDRAHFDQVPERYQFQKHAAVVTLNSLHSSGRFDLAFLDRLKTLPSFLNHSIAYKHGDEVKPSVDLFSAIGYIALVHEDPRVLQHDILTLKEWEKNDLFFLRQ